MKSLDYRYADAALQCIKEVEQKELPFKELYKGLCRQFPSMVRLNGLRLTVAFFEGKTKQQNQISAEAYQQYLEGIGQVLKMNDWIKDIPEDGKDYRRMTEQILRVSLWFKRYAEVFITESKEEERQKG